MSLEAHPVTHIQVENVSVADYAQYITHATPVHVMTDGVPEGATMTFIEHTVLDANQVLEPHQTIEVYQAIQQAGGLEQVILEQPIVAQITNGAAELQSDIKPPVGKGPFNCELCDKVFKKWNQLQRHMKSHDEDKPFRCIQCSVSFNIEDNLILHQATHVAENAIPTCPECKKTFSRVASLKAHIMMHEKEENLMCPECGDEFSVQSQLDRHMEEHREEHEGAKRHACRQCNQDFPKLAMLREHMKQHYKIKASLSHRTYKRNIDRSSFHHKCKHCTKTFQKPSQLLRHERIHTGERPFKCKICDKAFNQKGALQIHISKHTGEKPHMCEFCPMTFAQKGNLRAHIQRVHNIAKDGSRPTFECEECSCVFKKLGSLNAHISRAHSDTTDLPTQVEVRRVGPEEAKSINDTVIQQLLELSDQAAVMDGEEQDPETRQKQVLEQEQAALAAGGASDILQQALENSGLTDGHPTPGVVTSMPSSIINPSISTITVHDSSTGTIKKHVIRKVNGVRWHQCTYCSKEFKKPSDLVRHIRIHTHEKPYKCTQCFRAFAVKSTLTAHIKTHSGIKDHVCSVCNKLFSTQGSLKVHLRLHTGAKPFDCPHCDKKFRTSAHRKSHIHSHFRDNLDRRPRSRSLRRSRQDVSLPEIPLQEPILITDTGLIQQPPRNNNVFNQYLGESGSVDRPYKCHFCRRCFKKSSHLKQHIRSHTGEKPYRCNQCFRSFVSSGVLKAHSRTHTGVKAYKCLICDTTFTTNGSLKRHMSTHSEVRPFMCPYCQKTFKTSVNCKKHMKTHRHELALQALQTDEQVAVTEGETQSVEDTVVTTDDLSQPQTNADLSALQQDDIGHTTTITQQEIVPATSISQDPGSVLTQATLQDLTGTVIDHQLQQTLNQQVFGQQQNFGQAFLNGQQGFGQLGQTVATSLSNQLGVGGQLTTPLGTQVTNTINNQLTGQMTSMTNTQFSIQPQSLASPIDQHVTTSFSSPQSLATTMPSTSMQNILETRDVEETVEDQLVEETDDGEAVTGEDDIGDGKRIYTCSFCEKSFKKSSHLKQHVRSHTGEKPFKCSECSRMFVSTGVLKAHMKTHLGIKDYKCHICQATFTTNGSLTRHMMIHSSLRPFKCPFCNETFRTAVHCKRHMRVHRDGSGGVPPDSVPGDEENQAPNTRRTKSNITISDEHTEELAKNPEDELTVSEKILLESASEKDRVSEEKQEIIISHHHKHPHQCNHCPKSFKKPSDLMRHIRIHTGEKPFNCDKCGRAFTVKSTLDSHMKTHGPAQGDKRFKCHVCSSLFSTKGSLKVHMRLHTGAKPFKCPHCPGRFRTSGHRKSHILSHFKQDLPKKRKSTSRSLDNSQNFPVTMVSSAEVPVQAAGLPQQTVTNQVVSVDPSLLQAQSIMPISLTVPDSLTSLNESQLATQVLQGLEGIQLHFTSGLGQGIQIAGLDPSLLSQTVQIDASLLQQLQQQGNINITINPNVITQQVQAQDPSVIAQTVQATDPNLLTQTVQTADPNVLQQTVQADGNIITQTVHDPNLMQNIQIQPVSLQDTVNPNVIVQPMSSVAVTHVDAQQALQAQNITLQTRPDVTGFVVQDPMDPQVSHVSPSDASHMVVEQDQTLLDGDNDDDDEEDYEDCLDDDEDDDEDGIMQEHNSTIVHDDDTSLDFPHAMPIQDPTDKFTPQRNHICTLCNKAFKRSSHLKEHMTTHEPGSTPKKIKPTPHRCHTCDKAFQKPSQLMRHVRIHTGERPFVCNLCEKAFNQKNALQVHLKKHSGERPHQCNYCTLSFTQKGNLKTHIKRAHHLDMVQSMNLPRGFVPQAGTTINITSAGPPGDDEGLDLSEVVDLFQQ